MSATTRTDERHGIINDEHENYSAFTPSFFIATRAYDCHAMPRIITSDDIGMNVVTMAIRTPNAAA